MNVMVDKKNVINILTEYFPDVQAVYIFGSMETQDERGTSDVDIALLLPPDTARQVGSLAVHDVRFELESVLGRDVDLINLRLVNTVLQKEIVTTGRRVFCAQDGYATELFEMLTLSLYQKLNEERADIVQEIMNSGRVYHL